MITEPRQPEWLDLKALQQMPASPSGQFGIAGVDKLMGVKIRKRGGKWCVFVNYRGRRKGKRVGSSRLVAEQVKRPLEGGSRKWATVPCR